jgi:hypothetical protein
MNSYYAIKNFFEQTKNLILFPKKFQAFQTYIYRVMRI